MPVPHVLSRSVTIGLSAAVLIGLAGCAPSYSPNTYSTAAIQQANKVEPAVVVGFRQVAISANGTVGAVTGGAAGGILGAQVGPGGINSALGAVGGTAIGTILGTTLEHVTGDTTGWEYIVRKPNGELLSVTQREEKPIAIGQKVLVITGSQARVVPDYSTTVEEAPKPAPAADAPAKEPAPQEPIPLRPENSGNPAPAPAAPTVSPLPAPAAEPVPATPPAEPAPSATTAAPAEPAPPPPSL